ncbi:MAG: hypothetical protein V8T01_04000 [Oscillospiraceae bacterium]
MEGVYVYDGSEQTADVRGMDASMNITGDTGTDAGDYTVMVAFPGPASGRTAAPTL